MSNLSSLFVEFFKTGLFTYGGGYASLPFLYAMTQNYDWFSENQLTQFISISALTPGPVGLNMATYAGFHTSGFIGAIIASFALCLPMIILTSLVFKIYKQFSENEFVKSILYFLKPASCGLLLAIAIRLFYKLIILPKDFNGLILLIILFILSLKLSRNPVIYIGIASIFGIIINIL